MSRAECVFGFTDPQSSRAIAGKSICADSLAIAEARGQNRFVPDGIFRHGEGLSIRIGKMYM